MQVSNERSNHQPRPSRCPFAADLTINPAPANTVRVFVGRMELVSPATEKAVEAALASQDQASLQKYYRFLEPIVETTETRDPVKGNRLRELMDAPCNP